MEDIHLGLFFFYLAVNKLTNKAQNIFFIK